MEYRQCPHGFHHPPHTHSCDGCWCEGESDRRNYGWPHDTSPVGNDGLTDAERTAMAEEYMEMVMRPPTPEQRTILDKFRGKK